MNVWLLAGFAMVLSLVPCALAALRGSAERRLVGVQMCSILVIFALVIFTVGFGRLPFLDLALTLAVLSFGSGLVFARFLEKHL